MAEDDRDDELDLDDPLVRALRAPGSARELAGEHAYRADFRQAQVRRGGALRRAAGRAGVGATAAVTAVVLTAGVAAAYGRVLPDPVQRVAHEVLGPVGVPAPDARRPSRERPLGVPSSTPGRTPTSSPTAVPTGRPAQVPTPTTSSARPSQTPTGTAAPSPSATPTPTAPTASAPPRTEPAALTVRVSRAQVAPGAPVTVTGVLTDADGAPVRGRLVRLLGRDADHGWAKLGQERSTRTGRVSISTLGLERSTALQLRTVGRVRSAVVRVVVRPVLEVALSEGDGTSSVVLSARGGVPGDQVTVLRWKAGKLVPVATLELGSDASATYAVPTPKRPVRLVLRLPATKQHESARVVVTLGAKAD